MAEETVNPSAHDDVRLIAAEEMTALGPDALTWTIGFGPCTGMVVPFGWRLAVMFYDGTAVLKLDAQAYREHLANVGRSHDAIVTVNGEANWLGHTPPRDAIHDAAFAMGLEVVDAEKEEEEEEEEEHELVRLAFTVSLGCSVVARTYQWNEVDRSDILQAIEDALENTSARDLYDTASHYDSECYYD